MAGGTKSNAIPAEARAKIWVEDIKGVKELISKLAAEIKAEYMVEEEELVIKTREIDIEKVYTKDLSDNIIDYLMIVPDGVQYMSKDIEDLVLTSLNNAIIKEEGSYIRIESSLRSSMASSLEEIANRLMVMAKRSNATAKLKGQYPAWQYEEESKIRDICVNLYEEMFNERATVTAIHAGLECGILKKILPDVDMISFGPNLYDVHTEKEHLSIPSVNRMWKFLVRLLEELK